MNTQNQKILIPTKTFRVNEALFNEGDRGCELYVLKSGRVSIRKIQGGRENEITQLEAGSIVGEMAILDNGYRSASVIAIEETTVSIISQDSYEKVLQLIPSWLRSIVKIISHRLKAVDEQINLPLVEKPLLSLALFMFRKYRELLSQGQNSIDHISLQDEFCFLSRVSKEVFEEKINQLEKLEIISINKTNKLSKQICVINDDLLRLLVDSQSSIIMKKTFAPFEYERSLALFIECLWQKHTEKALPENASKTWWENLIEQFPQKFSFALIHRLARDNIFNLLADEKVQLNLPQFKQTYLAIKNKSVFMELK